MTLFYPRLVINVMIMLLISSLSLCTQASTNDSLVLQVEQLEKRINALENELETVQTENQSHKLSPSNSGFLLFSGFLCAFWASTRKKSPLLWFILGLILAPAAMTYIMILLVNEYKAQQSQL